jgi:hypothetical protein
MLGNLKEWYQAVSSLGRICRCVDVKEGSSLTKQSNLFIKNWLLTVTLVHIIAVVHNTTLIRFIPRAGCASSEQAV